MIKRKIFSILLIQFFLLIGLSDISYSLSPKSLFDQATNSTTSKTREHSKVGSLLSVYSKVGSVASTFQDQTLTMDAESFFTKKAFIILSNVFVFFIVAFSILVIFKQVPYISILSIPIQVAIIFTSLGVAALMHLALAIYFLCKKVSIVGEGHFKEVFKKNKGFFLSVAIQLFSLIGATVVSIIFLSALSKVFILIGEGILALILIPIFCYVFVHVITFDSVKSNFSSRSTLTPIENPQDEPGQSEKIISRLDDSPCIVPKETGSHEETDSSSPGNVLQEEVRRNSASSEGPNPLESGEVNCSSRSTLISIEKPQDEPGQPEKIISRRGSLVLNEKDVREPEEEVPEVQQRLDDVEEAQAEVPKASKEEEEEQRIWLTWQSLFSDYKEKRFKSLNRKVSDPECKFVRGSSFKRFWAMEKEIRDIGKESLNEGLGVTKEAFSEQSDDNKASMALTEEQNNEGLASASPEVNEIVDINSSDGNKEVSVEQKEDDVLSATDAQNQAVEPEKASVDCQIDFQKEEAAINVLGDGLNQDFLDENAEEEGAGPFEEIENVLEKSPDVFETQVEVQESLADGTDFLSKGFPGVNPENVKDEAFKIIQEFVAAFKKVLVEIDRKELERQSSDAESQSSDAERESIDFESEFSDSESEFSDSESEFSDSESEFSYSEIEYSESGEAAKRFFGRLIRRSHELSGFFNGNSSKKINAFFKNIRKGIKRGEQNSSNKSIAFLESIGKGIELEKQNSSKKINPFHESIEKEIDDNINAFFESIKKEIDLEEQNREIVLRFFFKALMYDLLMNNKDVESITFKTFFWVLIMTCKLGLSAGSLGEDLTILQEICRLVGKEFDIDILNRILEFMSNKNLQYSELFESDLKNVLGEETFQSFRSSLDLAPEGVKNFLSEENKDFLNLETLMTAA